MTSSRTTTEESERRRRRWLFGVPVVVVLLVCLAALALTLYRPAPAELRLAGSAATMGRTYGETCGLGVRLLCNGYIRSILCGGRDDVYRQRLAKAAARLQDWPTPYREELEALAAAAGVPAGALSYGNSLLDAGSWSAACRSVVATDATHLWHAHNLDWNNLGGLARWNVRILRRHPDDGRLRTVAVGFPGLVGALDIINEKGVALSFNQLGTGDGRFTEPVFVSLRRLADTCAAYDVARRELLALPPGVDFIVTLSGAATQEGAVFERRAGKTTERPVADGWVAATNAGQGAKRGGTPLDQLLGRTACRGVADIQAVMRHVDVLMGCNLYSVIWDFGANRFHLASGTIPAAPGRYRDYVLFE